MDESLPLRHHWPRSPQRLAGWHVSSAVLGVYPRAQALAPRGAGLMPSSSPAARRSGAAAFAFECLTLVYSSLPGPFLLSPQRELRFTPLKFMELCQCKTDGEEFQGNVTALVHLFV